MRTPAGDGRRGTRALATDAGDAEPSPPREGPGTGEFSDLLEPVPSSSVAAPTPAAPPGDTRPDAGAPERLLALLAAGWQPATAAPPHAGSASAGAPAAATASPAASARAVSGHALPAPVAAPPVPAVDPAAEPAGAPPAPASASASASATATATASATATATASASASATATAPTLASVSAATVAATPLPSPPAATRATPAAGPAAAAPSAADAPTSAPAPRRTSATGEAAAAAAPSIADAAAATQPPALAVAAAGPAAAVQVTDPGAATIGPGEVAPAVHAAAPGAALPATRAEAPPALPPLALPADPGAGFDDGLGTRIAWMADQRMGHAEIRLNPEHAGPIDVRVDLDGDRVDARFHSANTEVRAALEASLPRLRELLGEHGLQLGQADVGQQPRDRATATPAATGRGGGHGDAATEGTDATPISRVAARGLVDTWA